MHEKLTAYIPQLDDPGLIEWIGFCGKDNDRFNAGWNTYARITTPLLEDVGNYAMEHPEEEMNRYSEILERANLLGPQMQTADVSALDARTTMALLVYAYREDHFCNGAFLDYIKNGCVMRWLRRLQELDLESD